eukprot:jgi/Chrzof1/356/Cz01g12220.t1
MSKLTAKIKDVFTPGHKHDRVHNHDMVENPYSTGAGLNNTSTYDDDGATRATGPYSSDVARTGDIRDADVVEDTGFRGVGDGTERRDVHVVETVGHRHNEGQEVCGAKEFSEVEDRPVVKERVERYVEHHPVEKQYVVETRFVGERAIPTTQPITPVDVKEYEVERAAPGPKCPIGTGEMLDSAIENRRL